MADAKKPTFVNIGADDVVPILLNIDDLVVVQKFDDCYTFHSTAGVSLQAVTKDMSTEKDGRKVYDVLADDWLERIEDAGKDLLKINQSWLPGTDEEAFWHSYINPEKVAYMTVLEGEAIGEEQQYFIGLEHHVDRMGSHATPGEEIAELVKSIEEIKGKPFTRIDHEEATSDFFGKSYAVFDPDMITTICANGYDIRLEVSGTGYPLDFTLPEVDKQQLFQQFIAADPELVKDFDKVSQMISREADKIRKEEHVKFTDKIAALCPHLTEIPGADQPFYTHVEDIESVRYHQWDSGGAALIVLYNKNKQGIPHQTYPKKHDVRYEDAGKALKVFNQMAGLPRQPKGNGQRNIRRYRQKSSRP